MLDPGALIDAPPPVLGPAALFSGTLALDGPALGPEPAAAEEGVVDEDNRAVDEWWLAAETRSLLVVTTTPHASEDNDSMSGLGTGGCLRLKDSSAGSLGTRRKWPSSTWPEVDIPSSLAASFSRRSAFGRWPRWGTP